MAPTTGGKDEDNNTYGRSIRALSSSCLTYRQRVSFPKQPSGHAFILRRFDTGAISLTTMFRAAYPNATEQEEKREVNWVKENHDLSGNNGSGREPHITRLAGTWVGPDLATDLANEYDLSAVIDVVVRAQPDPSGNYRRSAKSNAAAASAQSPQSQPSPEVRKTSSKPPSSKGRTSAAKSLPTPSPTSVPTPAKRRKESSPAPSSVQEEPEPTPSQIPRRSTRVKSPAPRTVPMPSLTSMPKPAKVKRTSRKSEVVTDENVPPQEDDDEGAIEDVASADLREQDIREQREMIEDLKAQRAAAAAKLAAEADDAEEDESMEDDDGSTKLKRTRDEAEEGHRFDFKEPENEERAIVTNKRVPSTFQRLRPQQKSIVWGAAAFSLGLAAM